MSNNETPINSTNLTEKELENFKQRLFDEKKNSQKKIEELEESIQDIESNMGDNVSSSAHHQGNIASAEEQRETKYTLIEKQKDKLEKIKVALDRIETGNYGTCVVTGNSIQKERLEAMPYAIHSVDAMKGNINTDKKKLNVKDVSN
ncbi:MAG: TraR/DksA C4-type zinc finger protein [Balneola sp.]